MSFGSNDRNTSQPPQYSVARRNKDGLTPRATCALAPTVCGEAGGVSMHASGMFRFIRCRQLRSPLKRSPPPRGGGEQVTPKGEPHPYTAFRLQKERSEPLPRSRVSFLHICRRLQQPRKENEEYQATSDRRISDRRHVSQEASRWGASVPLQPSPSWPFKQTLSHSRVRPVFLPQDLARRKGPGVTVQSAIRLPPPQLDVP